MGDIGSFLGSTTSKSINIKKYMRDLRRNMLERIWFHILLTAFRNSRHFLILFRRPGADKKF